MTEARTGPGVATEQPSDPEQPNTEVLKLNLDYHAVYGRLLPGSVANPQEIPDLLDATKPVEETSIRVLSIENRRDYDKPVWGLSKHERITAWEDVIRDQGFDKAYSLWSESLYRSINATGSEERNKVVEHFFRKRIADIDEQADIQEFYDDYADGKSNITKFVDMAQRNPDLKIAEVEWLAKKLFGKDSGSIVARIMEVESSIKIDSNRTIEELFGNQDKINRIGAPEEGYEKDILGKLHDNFEWPPIGVANRQQAARPTQTPKPSGEGAPATESTQPETVRPIDRLFIRSRVILEEKPSGNRYYINILDEYADPDKGELDENRLLTLEPIDQGDPSGKMTKAQLLAKVQGNNPNYYFDVREGSKIKYKDEEYYLRTYYFPGNESNPPKEKIRFFSKFENKNEDKVKEMPRDNFDRIDPNNITVLEAPIAPASVHVVPEPTPEPAGLPAEPDPEPAAEPKEETFEGMTIRNEPTETEVDDEKDEFALPDDGASTPPPPAVEPVATGPATVEPAKLEEASAPPTEIIEHKVIVNKMPKKNPLSRSKKELADAPPKSTEVIINYPISMAQELLPGIIKEGQVISSGKLEIDSEKPDQVRIVDAKIKGDEGGISTMTILLKNNRGKRGRGVTAIIEKDDPGPFSGIKISANEIKNYLSGKTNNGWSSNLVRIEGDRLETGYQRKKSSKPKN